MEKNRQQIYYGEKMFKKQNSYSEFVWKTDEDVGCAKNVNSKWIRLTLRKNILAQTRDTSLAHTLETQFFDWLFDWPDENAPAGSFTCTFHPHGHFITDWDQSNFVE